jgi:hypothetical protein
MVRRQSWPARPVLHHFRRLTAESRAVLASGSLFCGDGLLFDIVKYVVASGGEVR